ncbi:MAG: ArsA-related P-loop ATPase [Aquificota bacterium]|nr:ArsA-related P-loop ATPase [Aquificota bacterium]
MPTVLKWYMNKVFKTERLVMRVARPVVGRLTDVPLPDEAYFKALENFYEKLKGVDEILVDPETTSVRLVVNPEKMVIRESQRAFMYFNLFGVNVDAVIVNRVIPGDLEECAYFKEWVSIQKRYIEEVETFFSPVPVLKVPLMKEEVLGEERLRELSEVLYGERDPAEVLFKERPYEFVKEDRGYTLKIKAPSVTKEKSVPPEE